MGNGIHRSRRAASIPLGATRFRTENVRASSKQQELRFSVAVQGLQNSSLPIEN
jgi:hypothetical protein